MENEKDKWDKLTSISGLVAGILAAIIGGMFTYVYRANERESLAFQHAQELRVSQVKAIQSFMPYLASSNKKEQEMALLAITALGNEELATKLAELIRSEGAILALSKIAIHSEKSSQQAVSALIQALQDKNSNVRSAAVEALGSIGPAVKAQLPMLTILLKDNDRDVRIAALNALRAIGPDAIDNVTIACIIKTNLKDSDIMVREAAAEALSAINKENEHNKAN